MKKKLRKLIDWYIKGEYHCDKCKYCWSEYSYDGDGDCGCYIFGDIRDTCRLLPPLRWLIGWPRRRKALYWEVHQYDGCDEWFENVVAQDTAMEEAIRQMLAMTELYSRDCDGQLYPLCKEDVIAAGVSDARYHYEEACHPVVYPSLRQEWRRCLQKTWKKIYDTFAPYFVRL